MHREERVLHSFFLYVSTYFFIFNDMLKTIIELSLLQIPQGFRYTAAFTGSAVCTAFNGLYGLGLDKKYYQPKELTKKIKNLSK